MKNLFSFLRKAKDGGAESTVTGFWLVEIKRLFSLVFLRFDGASREAFHNHAFTSLSWVLRGELRETMLDGSVRQHRASPLPFVTTRSDFHRVDSVTDHTWVFSIRGPWRSTWEEWRPLERSFVTLTNGRREIERTFV